MTSIELAKSIYERAQQNGKQAWLSNKQNSYLFGLLSKENRLDERLKRHFVAVILPSGEWVETITAQKALEIGHENIKYAYIVSPPFYIRREGFVAQRIVVEQAVCGK